MRVLAVLRVLWVFKETHKEGFEKAALEKSPSPSPALSGFVGMKNELLCGVATVVDCIYGTKLNLMLLAISSQYFFPLSLRRCTFFPPSHHHQVSTTTKAKFKRRVKFMFQICLLFISFIVSPTVHFKIIQRLKYILKMPKDETKRGKNEV